MSLNARLAKLEVITGGRVPTEAEMIAASRLLARHFEAVVLPRLTAETADEFPDQVFVPDPGEALLMRAAEASGQVAAAEDVMKRYRRAKGYIDPTEAEFQAKIGAEIAEMTRIAELFETSDPSRKGATSRRS